MNTANTPCCELTVLHLVPFVQHEGNRRFFALRLSRPDWTEWKPGQFIMVRPESFGLEYPWGRPLGICLIRPQHLICFFQVVGRGTEQMSHLRTDDKVRVWGPLGNGFAMEPDTPTLLLAGGMGIAPFIGYVAEHPRAWNLTMLFGHTAPIDCYPVDSINERIPIDTLRETVPGDLDNLIFSLEERIKEYASQNGLILACGPTPFLRTIQKFASQYHARCQLSLENKMAAASDVSSGRQKPGPIPRSAAPRCSAAHRGPFSGLIRSFSKRLSPVLPRALSPSAQCAGQSAFLRGEARQNPPCQIKRLP